jgi:hypothetical protein
MERTDLGAVERRFRRVYELARLKQALVGFVPILLLILAAMVFGGRPAAGLVLGPFLFAGGVLALWYGREPGRGVLPGVLAGGAALVLVLCANQMGHFCTGERCLSWCLPACITGGLLAGGLVSFVGLRQRRGPGYWLSASGITLLTGALGCSCVGLSGMIGLAAGFIAVSSISLATAALRSKTP